MSSKVIVSVTSDLNFDQRVHKVSQTLHEAGFEVILVGRQKKNSQKLDSRNYKTKRFKLWFEKGFLFYANYNLCLFYYLLFNKSDILLSNDLDTLLPNYIISKIKKTKLVYDTHEYFTGVPELLERQNTRKIWKKLEDFIFPNLNHIYTVNDSIAEIYHHEYKKNIYVIRNLPYKNITSEIIIQENYLEKYNQIKNLSKPIILYQGALNKDRGLEEMIEAMNDIDQAFFVIIGDGDVAQNLKVQAQNLQHKVIFTGLIPFQILPQFTKLATIGISIEKATNINYKFASPNKVVDYIHSEVPVLASNLVEISKIIQQFDVGRCINWSSPKQISIAINEILSSKKQIEIWKNNCAIAKNELNWDSEKIKLLKIFNSL